MERIYSEEELVTRKGMVWGEWTFALSEEEINAKIASLPKSYTNSTDDDHWSKLFSVLQLKPHTRDNVDVQGTQLDGEVEPMECSSISINQEGAKEDSDLADISVEDLSVCLVDNCNQAVSKLRLGFNAISEEMNGVTKDLERLQKSSLVAVMNSAWSELHTEPSKLCFCVPFCSRADMCEILCKTFLLPWLSNSLPSRLEVISSILSVQGETVCQHLVAPLLQVEDSPLVKDLLNLEDLMASMTEKHWTKLLREFLSNLDDIQKCNIPPLAMILEHASPSSEDLHHLVQLMSSTGTAFSLNRDFGSLLVAVVSLVKSGSTSLTSQLSLIANNYKGPLKFKALKILEDLKD